MAFSNDSSLFRLNFTDGTFLTLINTSSNAPKYYQGIHEFMIPNFYIGDFDDWSGSQTKYDANGNKYEFSNRGVIINNTNDWRRQASRMYFGYDPTNHTLSVSYCDPIPEFIPSINRYQYNTTGLIYNSDTSGTSYASIGELLSDCEALYPQQGWYRIDNILKRTSTIPMHGLNTFYGITYNYGETLRDMLVNSHTATAQLTLNIDNCIEDEDPNPSPTDDPYEPGGTTGPGGGTGDLDGTGDDIDIPSLPTLSAVDTGFITLYRPSASDLKNLANYLWSSPLAIWDNLKKIVQQPMDCILGLSIVPVDPSVGSATPITIADVNTGVNSYPITSQYVEIDCGTLNVNEYWGAYLDYDPYTKAEIYLPYIGTHPLSVDDIMNKAVTVKYHVDVLSGACTAYVKCGGSVLYEFIGQCSSSIPISGNDWTNVVNGALNIATAVGSMVATGGLSAPISAGDTGKLIQSGGQIASTAINSMKPSIEKSGAISGTGAMLGVQTPYIILTRPRQAVPVSQNKYMGYPSFITSYLGNLSGYTILEEIHLEGIPGTDDEIQEIETLLKTGVIL